MKYYITYIAIICSTFLSCVEGGESDIPNDLIERDIMVDLISEVELTQAIIKLKFSKEGGDTINSKKLYDQVFNEFDVSEDQFNTSLKYYCRTPRVAMEIYSESIERLSEKQAIK